MAKELEKTESTSVTPEEKKEFLAAIREIYERSFNQTFDDLIQEEKKNHSSSSPSFKITLLAALAECAKNDLDFRRNANEKWPRSTQGLIQSSTDVRHDFRKKVGLIINLLSQGTVDAKIDAIQEVFREFKIHTAFVKAFDIIHKGQTTYTNDRFAYAHRYILTAGGISATAAGLFIFGLVADAKKGFPFFAGHLGKMPNSVALTLGIGVLCATLVGAYYVHKTKGNNSAHVSSVPPTSGYVSLDKEGTPSPSNSPIRDRGAQANP